MYVYVVIEVFLAISAVFADAAVIKGKKALLGKKTYEITDIIFIIFAVILVVMSAIRVNIGTDYNVYSDLYNSVESNGNSRSFPQLFYFIMRFMKYLGLPYHTVIVLCTLSFLIPFFILITKTNSDYRIFALAYLMGMGFYGASYNIFRQYAAMGFIYLAIYYLANKDFKKVIIYSLLGIGFHTITAVLILFVIIVNFWKPKKQHIIFLSIFAVIVFIFVSNKIWTELIVKIISLFQYFEGYKGYALTGNEEFWERIYNQSAPFLSKISFFPCIYILGRMLIDKNYTDNISKIQLLLAKLFYVYTLITCFKLGSDLVTRFLSMFSISGVFAIPIMFNYISYKHKDSGKMIYVIGIAFYFVLLLYGIIKSVKSISINGGEIYPYQTLFSLW